MPRTVIFGNSGSGKTTLAKRCAADTDCAHLDLDTVAWEPDETPPTRLPVGQSKHQIDEFLGRHANWVIEGCYADLLALVAPCATELIFLNPRTDICIANARRRPWEPHKYADKETQDANLDMLIEWILQYETRDDECSLVAHRRLFDQFTGDKCELTSTDQTGLTLSRLCRG